MAGVSGVLCRGHLRATPVPGVEVHGLADHDVVVCGNGGPSLGLGAHLQETS